MDPKKLLGQEIARLVKNNEILGLGTGSTADEATKAIGERIKKEKLTVYGVPTANRTAELAVSVGIKVRDLGEEILDWGFDGADEVERVTLNILKGGGGAMTREKLVAKKCRRWIVIVDESKLVDQLGSKIGIPIEVVEEQMPRVIENIFEKYQPIDIAIRQKKQGSGQYRTDFGNPVLDVKVTPGTIKPQWEREWERLPGVVGTGLFLGGYADWVWVGKGDGTIEKLKTAGSPSVTLRVEEEIDR